MAIEVACGSCATKYRVDNTYVGKTIACTKCGHPIKIENAAPTVAVATPTERVPPPATAAPVIPLTYASRTARVPRMAPIATIVVSIAVAWMLAGFYGSARTFVIEQRMHSYESVIPVRWLLSDRPLDAVAFVLVGAAVLVYLLLSNRLRVGELSSTISVLVVSSVLLLLTLVAMCVQIAPAFYANNTRVVVGYSVLVGLALLVLGSPIVALRKVLMQRADPNAPAATPDFQKRCGVFCDSLMFGIMTGPLFFLLTHMVYSHAALNLNRTWLSGARPRLLYSPVYFGASFYGQFIYRYEAIWLLGLSLVVAGLSLRCVRGYAGTSRVSFRAASWRGALIRAVALYLIVGVLLAGAMLPAILAKR
jgi:hypothetical protein